MMVSGNMTGPNLDTYYSSSISLRSVRTVVFLAEFNNTESCTGDIIIAYLNARTTQKIVFNSVPEFEPFIHECHLILIKTVLYVLNSSCIRFHFHISDAPTALGFVPSMGECDIWMRNQ